MPKIGTSGLRGSPAAAGVATVGAADASGVTAGAADASGVTAGAAALGREGGGAVSPAADGRGYSSSPSGILCRYPYPIPHPSDPSPPQAPLGVIVTCNHSLLLSVFYINTGGYSEIVEFMSSSFHKTRSLSIFS